MPLGYGFGPAVVRIATNKGQLVIETDREVEVILKQGGNRVRVIDTNTNRTFDITAGDYEMEIAEVPNVETTFPSACRPASPNDVTISARSSVNVGAASSVSFASGA